jgi:hypothetical protein
MPVLIDHFMVVTASAEVLLGPLWTKGCLAIVKGGRYFAVRSTSCFPRLGVVLDHLPDRVDPPPLFVHVKAVWLEFTLAEAHFFQSADVEVLRYHPLG